MKRPLIILIFIFLFPVILFSQENKIVRNLPNNWKAGSSVGVSYLAFELKKNFQKATMDMNSKPNVSYSVFAYKRFNKQIETGIEFEKCFFKGFKYNSSNVNWLVYDQMFNYENSKFLSTPIYYNTDISTFYLNFIYNFFNVYSWKRNFLNMNLYLKAGLGFSFIGVELGYTNPTDYALSNLPAPLFEKGQGRQPHLDSYGTFHTGFGFNYYLSSRFSISAEADLLFVSADYLDGVHNFNVTRNIDGSINYSREGVFDLVGEIKVGISYHFHLYRDKMKRSSKWIAKNDTFRNEFYLNKKFNRVIKPMNPYSNEDLEKTLKKRKFAWR